MKPEVPPLPDRVPKRRALGQALDAHIALWLAGDGLRRTERRDLEAERERRRRQRESRPIVGVVVPDAGLMPPQLARLDELLAELRPGEVHHGGARPIHRACQRAQVPSIRHDRGAAGQRDVVRLARIVLAFSKDHRAPVQKDDGVWALVRYAKHRRTAVRVVLPDGSDYINEKG